MPKKQPEIDPTIDVEAEIEKARARMKSRNTLESETDKLAAVVKKERKAAQKRQKATQPPPQAMELEGADDPEPNPQVEPEVVATPKAKRQPRFPPGSEEAKEWGRKMAEAKAAKRKAVSEKAKEEKDLEERYEETLMQAQKAKLKALEAQVQAYESNAKQVKKASKKKAPKVVVEVSPPPEEDSESSEEEPEPVPDKKKKVSKKAKQQAVAQTFIEEERDRAERELMLQRMRSVIPNYGRQL